MHSLAFLLVCLFAFSHLASASAMEENEEVEERVVLRRVPDGGIQPEAVRDAAGRIHLLYFSGAPAGGDLYYVRSDDDGTTFSSPLRVNSEPGSAIAAGTIRGGQLALGRNGRPHVAWNGSGTAGVRGPLDPSTGRAGAQMFYSRLNASSKSFEPQRGLIQRTLHLDGGGSIAADESGHVYVAWHGNDLDGAGRDEATRSVWIARSSNDGQSFSREHSVWNRPTGVCACCALELFVVGGAVHLMYRSATSLTNRDIHFLTSTDRGRSFRGGRIDPWKINACPMTSMSFAMTGTRLLGAWETEGKVFMSTLDPGQSRAVKIMAPEEATAQKKHPRLAVNARGETLLVWTEGTGWSRGGSVAWAVFGARGERTAISGKRPGVPVWSCAAAVPRRDGGFVVFY
ncbi:MAG TPA: hypothetical protein VNJ03_11185 [Vicinamibacterales bacterium]|nr:hypothetical protein [Vicinamibacterales bacterium]